MTLRVRLVNLAVQRTVSADSLSDQAIDLSENFHERAGEEQRRRGDAEVTALEVEINDRSPSAERDVPNPLHCTSSSAFPMTFDLQSSHDTHSDQKSVQDLQLSEEKPEGQGSSGP